MQALPTALAGLADYRQFILYRVVPSARPGKMDKKPVDWRTGWTHDPHDPDIWLAFDEAAGYAPLHGCEIGFVLSDADPFYFVDIDGCLQADGTWSPLAQELCRTLAGAAVEISQSGTGLHIIGTLASPLEHGCKNTALNIELYTDERFIALTGTGAVGDVRHDTTVPLQGVAGAYFREGGTADLPDWSAEPVPEWDGYADDDELLLHMLAAPLNAGNLLANRATPAQLWTADSDALSRSYPDFHAGRLYDPSSADGALALHLAYWTGKNCERIRALMWRSALVRPKWTRHRTYLERTIRRAVARCERVHRLRSITASDAPAAPAFRLEVELCEGFQFLAPTQQIDHFAGCVYISSVHRIFTPAGALLRSEQFNVTYGGYTFAMDTRNERTTRKAWEAFTESQAVRFPRVDDMTFRPAEPSGAIIEEQGRRLVNSYVPAQVDAAEGDVGPFLRHLEKLLPDPRDQAILLAYMAACVQRVGIKFQWAPLLQGVEGNGKTLFSRCVAEAVGRRHSHWPKADELSNKFNAWMVGKLFIGVEDVHYPEHKAEIIESLKPMITNDYLPVEFKGIDQVTVFICANFILNTNHKDAVRKTSNDRRFTIFYTAQQCESDLTKCGMDGDYFPDLYDWLKGSGRYADQPSGYAMVTHFLRTYAIPEHLDPAGASHRAPRTSSTEQSLRESLGAVEQEIVEAIDEGRQGFAGGWVSGRALDQLLGSMRKTRAIPPNRRRALMQSIGYDYHPALANHGYRVPERLPTEGNSKPKLYVSNDHPALRETDPVRVRQAYMQAQIDGTPAPVDLAAQIFSGRSVDGGRQSS